MINKLISTKAVAAIMLIMLIALVGCKSKQTIAIESGGALKAKTHDQILEDVLTHELKYKTITTKGKVSLNGKEFTAIFKLVKDEFIQVSIRPILGIEAMRMDLSPEKAILLDRLGGRYSEVNIKDSEASEMFAFNFYNLQALLTNQLFLAGNKRIDKTNYKNFTITTLGDKFLLIARDKNDLSYNFSVDASDRIVSTSIMLEKSNASMQWSYDGFVEDRGAIYPTTMLANIKIKKTNLKLGVSYSDLDVDTNFNIDKSIPSRYSKISITDLIGAYTKLK